MDNGRRSGDLSGYVVKHKSSSGCLIVRKKCGDHAAIAAESSGLRKKEKKRRRLELSDSSSSDEFLIPSRKSVGHDTVKPCRSGRGFDKGSVENSEIGGKRNGDEHFWDKEAGAISGSTEKSIERKSANIDVFEFDEYDGIDDVMPMKKLFDYSGLRPSALKGKYESDKHIRIQGKNGVLKIMVNKKKKVGESSNSHDGLEDKEYRKDLRMQGSATRHDLFHSPIYTDSKTAEKESSSFKAGKKAKNVLKTSSEKDEMVDDDVSDDNNISLNVGVKKLESHRSTQTQISTRNKIDGSKGIKDGDTPLKLGRSTEKACKSVKGESSSRIEKNTCNQLLTEESKRQKAKHCTGTEKQKLRERIKEMLLDAGWTIDYRPRRNRDYLDAVYINPSGTGYWSIIKAYETLQKQLTSENDRAKLSDGSPFMPLADEVLNQLTRRTRKIAEEGMKKKQISIYESESEDEREFAGNKISEIGDDEDNADSNSDEEKLSTFLKQGSKSLKSRVNNNGNVSVKSNSSSAYVHNNMEKASSLSKSHNGGKNRKLGRCTLMIRYSSLDSESDSFVPYSGKRTLLSWLIDCGTVQLRQKVRYMNRRRSKAMLEGWLTRDGIHCGCCSKILTVSKFEIHAGSKLHQPFQNVYLDSGISLFQCQIDAWKQQESSGQIGFHSVDVNCDDPNDDTCGLCGDGGDLICCDGCPSTFHQSCLGIELLPPGDWHCQNCTCKFCGLASNKRVQGDDTNVSTLLTCSLCAKRYHNSCMPEMENLSFHGNSSKRRFCGQKCEELFEQLQEILGVKHELEAGLSWSLLHKTDTDSDASTQGITQRIECNSKLAVALSVMDECFLPIIDRRSGINVIHNVLYNCGSNFDRLNYTGFYTAILERGDEIISAASIRLHGTRLAEMPFIGTRPLYRHQGMCSRLFDAIESALCSLRVEKLIIPAVSELTNTWTDAFGFTTLQKLLKQELKSMNVLVFPGIDLLQKQLLNKKPLDVKMTTVSGKQKELDSNNCTNFMETTKLESDIPAGEKTACDNHGQEHAKRKNELVSLNPGCPNPDDCFKEKSVTRSSDSSQELKEPVLIGDPVNLNVDSGDESVLDEKDICMPEACDIVSKGDGKVSPVEQNGQPVAQISSNVTGSSSQCLVSSSETCSGAGEEDNVAIVVSSSEHSKEGLSDSCHAVPTNEFASYELNRPIAVVQAECLDTKSDNKFNQLASFKADQGLSVTEVDTKTLMDSPVGNKYQTVKEGDSGGAKIDLPGSVVAPSTDNSSDENCAKKIEDVPGAFVSTVYTPPKSDTDGEERILQAWANNFGNNANNVEMES